MASLLLGELQAFERALFQKQVGEQLRKDTWHLHMQTNVYIHISTSVHPYKHMCASIQAHVYINTSTCVHPYKHIYTVGGEEGHERRENTSPPSWNKEKKQCNLLKRWQNLGRYNMLGNCLCLLSADSQPSPAIVCFYFSAIQIEVMYFSLWSGTQREKGYLLSYGTIKILHCHVSGLLCFVKDVSDVYCSYCFQPSLILTQLSKKNYLSRWLLTFPP